MPREIRAMDVCRTKRQSEEGSKGCHDRACWLPEWTVGRPPHTFFAFLNFYFLVFFGCTMSPAMSIRVLRCAGNFFSSPSARHRAVLFKDLCYSLQNQLCDEFDYPKLAAISNSQNPFSEGMVLVSLTSFKMGVLFECL